MNSGWWSRRAITLHVALIVAVPSFLTLGFWQLSRALHGNVLSWAYTFEWPFFAGYATWMWWRLVHEEVAERAAASAATAGASAATGDEMVEASDRSDLVVAATPAQPLQPPAADGPAPQVDWDPYDESDPELAAYNRYLASLHAGRQKR